MTATLPLTIVAAVARNGALGMENTIPWRAPSDLKRFREITWGRPLILGRMTYESIGRPLPGREMVVVSRNPSFFYTQPPEHVHPARSFGEALLLADRLGKSMNAEERILAGGAELYRLGLPHATFLRLTLVDCAPRADAFFPDVDWSQWQELRRETPKREPKDEFGLEYVDYRRI